VPYGCLGRWRRRRSWRGGVAAVRVGRRKALLVNPFYRKDPHGSFGKHVLTPYPGTPLFRRMEAEGRLLHRDWDRYDTATAVFRPKHMTPEELEAGYAYCYRRLFSLRSIWKRRRGSLGEILPYLAATLLYKKSNRFWHVLIKRRFTAAVWRPLLHIAARRHRTRRQALGSSGSAGERHSAGVPVSAGV